MKIPRWGLLVLALLINNPASAGQIAVTIDDLPLVSASRYEPAQQLEMVRRVYQTVNKHHVRAMGFVIGQAIKPHHAILLDELVAAGHIVGNHTFSHPDFNETSIADYEQDILRGEKAIRPWVSGKKYFRYPMLHHGQTKEKKEAIEFLLNRHDILNVPVSIDNDEWMFNRDYVDAMKSGNRYEAQRIGENYLLHMKERTQHFRDLARKKLGRDIKHILLIHMNPLNADYLDRLLSWYEDAGWTFVDPEEALSDPIYSMEDQYTGTNGISWLLRILRN